MKILKQEDISNWEYKHVCSSCDSELLVEPSDLKHQESYDQRDGSYDGTFTSKCPVCSQVFYIPAKVIPKRLQIQVKQQQKDYYDNHSH